MPYRYKDQICRTSKSCTKILRQVKDIEVLKTSLTVKKIKKFGQFLKILTMKSSIFKNERTSHPEILIQVYI